MSDLITIDDKQMKKYIKNKLIKRKSQVAGIYRGVLNNLAFDSTMQSKKNVKKNYINRNKFVERSIQFDKARGSNVNTMFSRTGSRIVNNFTGLKDQEFGATRASPDISTVQARIGGNLSKAVSTGNRYTKMTGVVEIDTQGSRFIGILRKLEKQRYKGAIYIKSPYKGKGPKTVRKGFYKFGTKTFRQNGVNHKHLKMIKDLSKSSIRIRPRPWHKPAIKKIATEKNIKKFYKKNFERMTSDRLK